MQPVEGVFPTALVDEVVPLRNQVIDRAARIALAKRHAAIHATSTLRPQKHIRRGGEDFQEIFHPLQRIAVRHRLAFEFFKTCGFAHCHFIVPEGRSKIAQRFIAGNVIY
jgi:hypothetical protein